jgi:hypothetical protein
MNTNALMTQFAGVAPGGAAQLHGSHGGSLSALGSFEELAKALQASNYTTDVAQLSGGGALGIQSLDVAMKTTIQEEEHFSFFKRLQQTSATNIVDEYVRQTGVGGHLGGSTNTQMGVVRAAQGEYSREVGLVKFLMSLRQVGYVLNIGKNIVEATATEERNGALQLLTDAEYLLFYGNAGACPTQFDGIFTQIDNAVTAGEMSDDSIVSLDGQPLTTVDPFSKINTAASRYGSFGRSTDVYLPNLVQTDLNGQLDPAYRWSPTGGNTPVVGGHVEGIRLTHGILKTNMDVFLHDDEFPMAKPFEVTYASTATANVGFKPASIAGVPGANAASMFSTGRDGNYYYAVAGIGANGEGYTAVTLSAQVAVAVGEQVVLTIAQSPATTETGYAIYRSKRNGTNTVADFRLMKVVPKDGATTVYTDQNRDIPGTCAIPVLNMGSNADAIGWRQFQPMTKIPLPFGVGGQPVHSWFQFLFGYLRVTKPKHHGYIKNILPTNAKWRPF